MTDTENTDWQGSTRPSGDRPRTLAERIRAAMPALSPAERRLVRHLLAGRAAAMPDTATALAADADVAPATLLRCLAKLGYPGYPPFRADALGEAAARADSALRQMRRRGADAERAPLADRARHTALAAIGETFDRLAGAELARALDLLADGRRRLIFAGGRFSQSLAEQLYYHAHLIRPGCELVRYTAQDRRDRLADVGRAHVLTVFDFRRYQRDSVEFAREAKRRRVKIVLVTDPWMSPIADWADVVLTAAVSAPSPFDSLVAALALTEALVAGLYERLGEQALARLRDFEELDDGFAWGEADTQRNGNDETGTG
ncbi:MAG: MurR/RpiR family transcriptional regulator [Alphaproteobacteria bacterium]